MDCVIYAIEIYIQYIDVMQHTFRRRKVQKRLYLLSNRNNDI